jgi:hypothetical protein
MSSDQMKGIVVCLATCMTLACSQGPFANDSSGSTQNQVRFSLAKAQTPLDVCLEADLVTLDVSPDGVISGGPSQNVFPTPCEATFTVTVKKNREVTFTGQVLGGEIQGQERQLLIGQARLPASEAKDGFDVRIQLSEIDALRVVTETIGPGPANDYSFTVNGHPNTPLGIGHNDTTVVPAVAAGSRMVDLDPSPCAVSDLMPDPRPVGVPVPSGDIGEVKFTVDCLSGVNVTWVPGGCPTGITLDLVVDGNPPIPIKAGEVIVVGTLPAGTHTFELQNLPPGAQVATLVGGNIQGDNPAVVDLPVATNVDLTFVVNCGGVRDGLVGDLHVTIREIAGRSIRDRMDVSLDGAPAKSVSSSTSTATVDFQAVSVGNHTVRLTLVGGACLVDDPATNPRQVSVPGSTTIDIECTP